MAEICRDTPWRHDSITLFGQTHDVPRLTALMGDEGVTYRYSRITMEAIAWSAPVADLRRRVEERSDARFNSVLLNWYRDGRDSNGWHADDEPELGDEPVIASLSLGVTRTMRFRRRDGESRFAVDLADGDLLVMYGDSQRDWLHTVAKSTRITSGRLNLTFRQMEPRSSDATPTEPFRRQ
jgi:alkylated DNA repair dioxygenase AlkB